MIRNDRRIAIGCWLVAGLPILGTFLQALLALVGVDAFSIPVLGQLKGIVDTVEVFDAAGVVFRDSDIAVFVLFILVALSWLGVGAGMFGLQNRQFTNAAAGLVTAFFALFFVVYSPLFTANVPTMQLVGFVLIPLFTVGAVWTGVLSYEWRETLDAETASLLRRGRETVGDARQTYQHRIEDEADAATLDRLRKLSSDAVSRFEKQREEFERSCHEIEREIDEVESKAASRQRYQQAKQLETRASNLDPETDSKAHLSQLRGDLEQEISAAFGTFTVTSTFGETFAIRNLRQYSELELDQGPPVQLGGDSHELDERLIELLDQGEPLPAIATAIETAERHLDRLRAELDDREVSFREQTEAIERDLSAASEALSRADDAIEDRLSEMLFDKRFGDETEPPFPTEVDVRSQLDTAREQFHDCRFDSAERTVGAAKADAETIKQIAVFFADSVLPTIEHGSGSIPIPSAISVEMVERLRPVVQRVYDVTYQVRGETLEIDRLEESTGEQGVTAETEQRRSNSGQRASGASNRSEDVLYLLQELDRAASNSDVGTTVTIQLGEYPPKFSDPAVLDELESFCERQREIESVDAPETTPGYIELSVAADKSPGRALSTACERYQDQ